MLTMKRPKEGVFTEREEEGSTALSTSVHAESPTPGWEQVGKKAFLCRTWIGSGSDYTLETMGICGRLLSLETMWSCLYFRVGWIKE